MGILLHYFLVRKKFSKHQRSGIIQSGNHFFLGYYAAGIKQEVWAFKDDNQQAVDRWVKKAIELSGNLPRVDCIVRALGHAETEAPSAELDLQFNNQVTVLTGFFQTMSGSITVILCRVQP